MADSARPERGTPAVADQVPCPYVYAKGRRCTGHIVGVEAFKADLSWTRQEDGSWSFHYSEPRSHYHLVCSEKGNHAGWGRPDAEAMKFDFRELPPELQAAISAAARV